MKRLMVVTVVFALGIASSCASEGDAPADAGSQDQGSAPSTFADPAPSRTVPGKYTCPGCPDSSLDTFQLEATGATTQVLTGTVLNALGNGKWYVQGPGGQAVGGDLPTDESTGDYTLKIPLYCGTQLVKCVWSNDAGQYVQVIEVVAKDCIEPDLRLTTSWDANGTDWELHLVRPGGRLNDPASDCTWTTCVSTRPEWGVADDPTDDPYKDVDDTGNFGPENITLARPQSGLWHVLIEHWGGGEPSAGRLIVQLKGKTWVQEVSGFESHHVWKAASIQWPEGIVRLGTDVVDCSAEWDSGCKASLP